jgi:hypothetical protein
MVKQVAGFLPVLAPLACLLGHERPRPRDLLAAGVAFLAVWAPWHMIMTALHGGAFWRGYLVHNVLERAATPLLGDSSPLFYLQALVRREGVPLALFLGATLGYGLLRARRRVIPDLVAALVPLLALVAFSLARTRVEYYLVAITPLLCALAAIPVARVPAAFVLMPLLAFLSHDLPDLSRLDPSGDVARLSRLAADAPRLYVIGLMPSAPRYYSGRPTTRLFADEADRARWAKIDVLGLPGVLEVVPDCERFPDGLVLVKRGDPVAERLAPCLGDAIDESPPYALVRSARGTPPASSPPQ